MTGRSIFLTLFKPVDTVCKLEYNNHYDLFYQRLLFSQEFPSCSFKTHYILRIKSNPFSQSLEEDNFWRPPLSLPHIVICLFSTRSIIVAGRFLNEWISLLNLRFLPWKVANSNDRLLYIKTTGLFFSFDQCCLLYIHTYVKNADLGILWVTWYAYSPQLVRGEQN